MISALRLLFLTTREARGQDQLLLDHIHCVAVVHLPTRTVELVPREKGVLHQLHQPAAPHMLEYFNILRNRLGLLLAFEYDAGADADFRIAFSVYAKLS